MLFRDKGMSCMGVLALTNEKRGPHFVCSFPVSVCTCFCVLSKCCSSPFVISHTAVNWLLYSLSAKINIQKVIWVHFQGIAELWSDDVRYLVVSVTDTQVWYVSGGFSASAVCYQISLAFQHCCLCVLGPF